MERIKPFDNESQALLIGDLKIENRLDRVSLYGSLDITNDKEGLALALNLKAVLDVVVESLESNPSLPERIKIIPTDEVPNPFSGVSAA